jgi:hypothetical protein
MVRLALDRLRLTDNLWAPKMSSAASDQAIYVQGLPIDCAVRSV